MEQRSDAGREGGQTGVTGGGGRERMRSGRRESWRRSREGEWTRQEIERDKNDFATIWPIPCMWSRYLVDLKRWDSFQFPTGQKQQISETVALFFPISFRTIFFPSISAHLLPVSSVVFVCEMASAFLWISIPKEMIHLSHKWASCWKKQKKKTQCLCGCAVFVPETPQDHFLFIFFNQWLDFYNSGNL